MSKAKNIFLANGRSICHNWLALKEHGLYMTKSLRTSLASLIAVLGLVSASAESIANNYLVKYGPILQSVPALELPG